MSKKIFIFFFLHSSFLLSAQYTGIINSNRPGFSESPYSVGSGIYQLEAGTFYTPSTIKQFFVSPESFGYELTFRTSFFSDKFEINTNLSYQKQKNNLASTYHYTEGINNFSFGAKYLMYQQTNKDKSKEIRSWKRRHSYNWKRVIPSVAIYAGVNTNMIGNIYKIEKITPKAGILLQSNLTNRLNVIANIFYNYIGSDYAEISYILSGTYSLNKRWSTFLEHEGSYNKYINNNNFGIGLAFLAGRNFQIDASSRLNFNNKKTTIYTALGFSIRLDNYRSSYDEIDERGNKIKDDLTNTAKKKNFFGNIVSLLKLEKKKSGSKYDRKRPKRKRIKRITKPIKKKKKRSFLGLF